MQMSAIKYLCDDTIFHLFSSPEPCHDTNLSFLILTYLILAPTQSPSYADNSPGNVNLPLSMDPVLAVVTNASGQQVSIMIIVI